MKNIIMYKLFESIMDTPFYIFGSENSLDYDIIVSVDKIPESIYEAHELCKFWNETLSKILSDKPLNCNLGVFDNNTLIDVHKGTVEELINVIYYTYDNHNQFFPNPIKEPVERDLNEKVLRVARFLISFYSRTDLRIEIKSALRGNLFDKLNILKKIDFVKMKEFPGKKESKKDILKVVAFQFGQVFSLIDGFEPDSYTKNDIIKNYPDLSKFLMRRDNIGDKDLEILNEYMERFIDYVEDNKSTLRTVEY